MQTMLPAGLAWPMVLSALGISACSSNATGVAADAGPPIQIVGDPRPDIAKSTIVADPLIVPADGTSVTHLTVTIKRSDGSLIANEPVVLTSSRNGDVFNPAEGHTDAYGIFTATMASVAVEEKTVTATFAGNAIQTHVNFEVCHGPLFLPFGTQAVGAYPAAIATADFDGDGKSDLATANANSGDLSILLGNGAGSFVPFSPAIRVPPRPLSMATGDFNGDGKPDLATTNTSEVNIRFWGGGRFDIGASLPTGVATGDFNGDGKLDLVFGGYANSNVSIWLGDGKGSFASASPPTVAVGGGQHSISTGDLNGDGKPDLVVSNNADSTVSILLGNGQGSFTAASPATIAVGASPVASAIGDFNGDQKLDIAVTNNGSNDVSILLGNGSGSFATASTAKAGLNPAGVVASDFDGDRKLDLVVVNNGERNASILLGDGAGSFAATSTPIAGLGRHPWAIAMNDFNADGRPDLAIANRDDNNVSIVLRTGCVP